MGVGGSIVVKICVTSFMDDFQAPDSFKPSSNQENAKILIKIKVKVDSAGKKNTF